MDSRLTFIIISAALLFSSFCVAKGKVHVAIASRSQYSVGHFTTSNQVTTKPSSDCVPSSVVMERFLLYHTLIAEMESVLTCQKVPSNCQRLPRMTTYYPGTMYRRTIDVGVCGGLCGDEMTCKATRITTVAVSTPNGKRSIEVIQNCSCVIPSCYRVSAYEAFPEQYIDARGEYAVRTKLIDMGKCVGNNRCPIMEKRHWPFTFTEAFQVQREIRCSKNTTEMQSYVAIGGGHVKVATIKTCSCN